MCLFLENLAPDGRTMMRVLLLVDTDVFPDTILERKPYRDAPILTKS